MLVAAAVLVSCGGAQELRNAEQASQFVDDIARGGKASEWELASGAAPVATGAWANRSAIERLGATLRDKGPEWACNAAKAVQQTNKVLIDLEVNISALDRLNIVTEARTGGAPATEANSLIDDALELTSFELVETVSATCETAEQF